MPRVSLLTFIFSFLSSPFRTIEYVEKEADTFLNPTNDDVNEFAAAAKGGGCNIL